MVVWEGFCWEKLGLKFTYLGNSVSSTEKDIDTRLTKARAGIEKLSIIWKSDLTGKMKCSFFQAAVVSILLYGCTMWTLTKRLEKKLDGNYTRMLRAILNKSWGQHPTRHQLFGHLPPVTTTLQVRQTRHAGHSWRNRDELKWCSPMDHHIWPWCPWIWTRRHEFKSWTRLIAFHIALIPLGTAWIQIFSLQLWVNSRTD